MKDFVKPVRKTISLRDAFAELINKDIIKDLHDNEGICPICHGTGIKIENNPYGLSDDPQKWPMFPYKHQSLSFCPNCYNGVVHYCPDCGKQLPRSEMVCDCDAVKKRKEKERKEAISREFNAATKYGSDALGTIFHCACSDDFPFNDGYFFEWEEFMDNWYDNHTDNDERPEYVWGTEEVEMDLNAYSIINLACEDLYEDAYFDIDSEAIQEMQQYFDQWKKRYAPESYIETHKCVIRIPWESEDLQDGR